MKPQHGPTIRLTLALAVLASTPAGAEDAPPHSSFSQWRGYNNKGLTAFERGDYKTAELRFNAAIKSILEREPSNQRLLARSYHDLGRTLYAQKRYDEALPLAEWVLRVRERDAEAEPGVLIDSLRLLGLIHREREHDSEAEALLRQAVEIQELTLDPSDPQIKLAEMIEELAGVELRLRKYESADEHYLWAIAIRKRHRPHLDPGLADAIEGRARALDQLGRKSEAQAANAEAQGIRDAALTVSERLRAVREGRTTFVPGAPFTPEAP